MEFYLASTLGSLVWRWQHLTSPALWALWFYLFPAAGLRWQRRGWLLGLMLVGGYGNIKYLVLLLLFIFPVIEA